MHAKLGRRSHDGLKVARPRLAGLNVVDEYHLGRICEIKVISNRVNRLLDWYPSSK